MQKRTLADGVVIDGRFINPELGENEKALRNLLIGKNLTPAELGERYRIGLTNLQKQFPPKK